jgi:hypothetical protein
MKALQILTGAAALTLLAAPAFAQPGATAPTAADAKTLGRLARDADTLATEKLNLDQRQSLVDRIDDAWNGIKTDYERIDVPADLPGTFEGKNFNVMDVRMSVLNSTDYYGDAAAKKAAQDVAVGHAI